MVLDVRALDLEGAATLPSLPTVALDVVRICQDPDSGIDELATVVGRDPALAARVLQMANSPFYNRGHEVTSVQRAALLLGRRTMKVVALGFSLASELPRDGAAGGFDLSRAWHRSLATAVTARSLALSTGSTAGEEAFLCGLLSLVGKIVLASARPDEYRPAVEDAGGWPTERSERDALGFTSSELAEALLRHWGLPNLVVLGATFGERPEELPDSVTDAQRELCDLVSLAQLATAVFFDRDDRDAYPRFRSAAARIAALDDAGIDALVDRLQRGLDEMAPILDVDVPPGFSYVSILEQARRQALALGLDAVMDLQTTEQRADELAVKAHTDALTGLPNRAAFDEFLARQVELRLRGPRPEALGLLMVDVDRFKSVNDNHGHAVGDRALRSLARAVADVTRAGELFCRFGGEEFCLVLPQTSPVGLRHTAERLRAAVKALRIPDGRGGSLSVTASVGGACVEWLRDPGDGAALVERADRWLYRAKQNGRDRCEICPDSELAPHGV